MTNRRNFLIGTTLGIVASGGLARAARAQATATLVFDPAAYETLTRTIATGAGDRSVTYRFWKAIPYVAKPVDVTYQSLNISQPVEIDGVAVDATRAPILFSNSVGGYMPSSVADADGIGAGGMGGPPPGGMPGVPGAAPDQAATGSNAMLSHGRMVSNAELALAAGYVVVEPGARGRTLVNAAGDYYGTAPAAIVDLKAALRYLHANAGRVPGDTDRIVSSGTSAGGALSALLGASGDSPLYAGLLAELGAAEAGDTLFAVGAWCPITDLDHADMAYEWNWGANPLQSGEPADQALSQSLRDGFAAYQAGLGLMRSDGAGPLSAETYGDYLLRTFMLPEATRYLSALSDADRASYLAANPHIGWKDGAASFDWDGFLAHVGTRRKTLPAFDAFDLSAGENNLFGLGTVAARHFTGFSLRHASGDETAEIAADLPATLHLMNPMPFLLEGNPARARHWWIRTGAKDSDTALTVTANLAAAARAQGDQVDQRYYWDAGHGANEDADDFIAWIARVTGYRP
ncbi:MAG: subtype B tannase [Paracoccus sp. (in: a-proteobacteria)]|nr:subtype B tannase [Paracoccus sp. (in: a-proteobacteria)]